MRVAYLAAGAGGMYCGSCMRDNRLAATLIAQGRDVVLIPLYTPLRTDETDVSGAPVYYGGLNVYLQQVFPPLRLLPKLADRVLDAPGVLRWVGKFSGSTRPQALGKMTVSVLNGEHGRQRKELEKLIVGLTELRPDVVNLANLMFIGMARRIHEATGAAIVCTLGGEDIFLDQLPQTHRGRAFDLIAERAADVDAFVSVTRYYADHAATHFHLPRERVHVTTMGIRVDEFVEAAPAPKPFTIGYLARICPEKGLEPLLDAFIALRRGGRDCRLRIAGYLGAIDRPYFERMQRKWQAAGVGDAVEHLGEVDRAGKLAMLSSLHVLCVPSVYPEAKGFYTIEALASGVPVVKPDHGSFPEIIEATGGGVLYNPADGEALHRSLAELMDDEPRRRETARRGRDAVRSLYTDQRMASQVWSLYESLQYTRDQARQSEPRP